LIASLLVSEILKEIEERSPAVGRLSPFVGRPEVVLLFLLGRMLESNIYLPLALCAETIYQFAFFPTSFASSNIVLGLCLLRSPKWASRLPNVNRASRNMWHGLRLPGWLANVLALAIDIWKCGAVFLAKRQVVVV
jgi:hypothetical protein